MRRLVKIVLALALLAGAAVLAAASESSPAAGPKYRIVFDNSFGLTKGGDFRVAAVTVGQTTDFTVKPSRTGPPKAVVEATVSRSGAPEFRTDARCSIKPQSLVGEYYVDCQPGSAKKKLGDGGTIPVEQTESTIAPDLVNDILRQPQRERLRLLVAGLGTGLAGRAEDFRDVLRRSHPGLRETQKVLSILARENGTIERFVTDADRVVGGLARDRREVRRFVTESGRTAETAATRREDLRISARRLPGLLRELRPSMDRLGDLSEDGVPLLADLRQAAPDLTRVLRDTAPFARKARPALRGLGAAAVPTLAALREGRQEVEELKNLASNAPATAKPLRQFLETMDDRRRAIETDSRAKANGPPAPDPTHIADSGGFTGFEGLANYFFWQALSVNAFDDIGHLLTISAVVSKCSAFANNPRQNTDVQRDCNNNLGPNQPGINSPDPSRLFTSASRARGRGAAPRREAERAPEAAPRAPAPGTPGSTPGAKQRQGLLDQLLPRTGKPLPGVPRTPSREPLDLLDFLLAP